MFDLEQNKIVLSGTNNDHMFICGKSGQGKSYLSCALIKEFSYKGKRSIVLDYSMSYTECELEKHGINLGENIKIMDLYNEEVRFNISDDKAVFLEKMVELFSRALNLKSYLQIGVLSKSIKALIADEDYMIDISDVMEMLHKMITQKVTSELDKKNIEILLDKFTPYKGLTNLKYVLKNGGFISGIPENVCILQVSKFSEKQRLFVTRLLLQLIWDDIKSIGDTDASIRILLDEVQFLSIRRGDILHDMLREGRKFGLGLILSTQFLSCFKEEEIQCILQADTLIMFAQTLTEITKAAKIIDVQNPEQWKKVLVELHKGQAVLKSKYTVNGSIQVFKTPIIITGGK